jgi:hypothetical protein
LLTVWAFDVRALTILRYDPFLGCQRTSQTFAFHVRRGSLLADPLIERGGEPCELLRGATRCRKGLVPEIAIISEKLADLRVIESASSSETKSGEGSIGYPQRFEGLTRATRCLCRRCYECMVDLLLGGRESRFGGGNVFLVLEDDAILAMVLGSRFTLSLGTSN